MKKKTELIVAVDVPTFKELRDLVDLLDQTVGMYKIGSQIFTACGPAAARFIIARGKKVFLDLKFHDIPNTVASAVRSAVALSDTIEDAASASPLGHLELLTVHTSGGYEMMKAAADAAAQAAEDLGVVRPKIVGVTVLTSTASAYNIQDQVLSRAAEAKKAGLDGVVASCHESAAIRKEFGPDFVIVTPGIRPAGEDVGDQKRVATPQDAVASGSNYIVVGRPIVKADNPHDAARRIVEQL